MEILEKERGGAYSRKLDEFVGSSAARTHFHSRLKRGFLSVSEIQSVTAPSGLSASLGCDEAYQIVLHLRNVRQEFWLDDRFASGNPAEAGNTYVIDLRQDPRVVQKDAGHTVHFHMPISSMKAYAERNDMPAFVELTHSPTVGFDDPVIRHLGAAAVAAFGRPAMTGDLLIDTILDAACLSVMGRYGTSRRTARPRSYGLAPWQERRAKELIDTCLDVSLAQLAQECGLSVEHFGRAFKQSTGMAPHQWQLERRTRRAKTLLAGSVHSIAEIALACGFSSQSHFSTAFRRNAGVSPGHWRRSQATDSSSSTI